MFAACTSSCLSRIVSGGGWKPVPLSMRDRVPIRSPLRIGITPRSPRISFFVTRASSESGECSGCNGGFPVFDKMVGHWEDSVRYVHATMEETPRIKLTGTREFCVTDEGTVTLKSSTVFPNGKTLELSFVGARVSEAFGLKDVVKFERVPLDGEEAAPPGYYPIVLLASEHPVLKDQPSFDTVVVREVLLETGRVLLSETITLLPSNTGEMEAIHAAQEVKEDGSLGGVQLWRSKQLVQ